MSGARRFFAPGKLMLAGEYSVLAPEAEAGGEALALAVAGSGVEVIGCAEASDWSVARADGQQGDDALRFARQALEDAVAAFAQTTAWRLVTHAVLPAAEAGGAKRGLGSSASTAAAMVTAVGRLAGREPSREELLAVAWSAHHAAQGDRGSGYDVAAAVYGGLVHFSAGPRARRLAWPAGLVALRGFSGQSARTTTFLARVAALEQADRQRLLDELGQLGQATRSLIALFERGELGALSERVAACHDALSRWDAAHQLGIITPAINELIDLARGAGATAKVSGAGGGDSVIALAGDEGAAEATLAAWRAAGFEGAVVQLDEQGARELPATS